MMNRMHQSFPGKSLWAPFWVIGLASLLIIALWWSGTSTALAQDSDNHDQQGGRGGDFGLNLSDPGTLQCIILVLGRIPSGIDDLTDDEKRAVGEQCLNVRDVRTDGGGGTGFSGGQGGLDDQGLQCVIATIGRVPAGENDLSEDEKRAVAEQCFGQHDPGADGQGGRPSGPNGPGDID